MSIASTATVTVKIAGEARSLEEADANWVIQRINGLRKAGQSVCLEMSIRTSEVRMALTSPDCEPSGSSGRQANRREQEVFKLWEQMGLNQADFNGGHVNTFLQRLRHLLS